jgi:hypothetical protein
MPIRRALLVLALALPTAAPAFDWKSWLHGNAEIPPKAPPPKHAVEVTFAAGAARDAEVEAFMRALAAAFMAREGRPLVARLSDKYAIDSLPVDSAAPELFVTAVERVPAPTEIVIQGIERSGAVRVAAAEFRYGSAPPKAKTFRFDAAGRLISSDLFSIKVKRDGS